MVTKFVIGPNFQFKSVNEMKTNKQNTRRIQKMIYLSKVIVQRLGLIARPLVIRSADFFGIVPEKMFIRGIGTLRFAKLAQACLVFEIYKVLADQSP